MTVPIQSKSDHLLVSDDLRVPLEQQVSAYLDHRWQVKTMQDKRDEASHPAAILTDESYAVFVKLGVGEVAVDQFRQEEAGLRLLTERAGVLTPTPISIIQVEEYVLFVMAAVQVVKREEHQWRQIGQALAQIHQIKGEAFGLASHCYWGSLYQDNRPLPDWPDFFWQRRMEPRLRAAFDSGRLPSSYVRQVEEIGSQLVWHCGPPVQPTLLHGDAHQNNFLSTAQGTVFIDPSVYYGHPEIDLAHLDFFAPVPVTVVEAYQESGLLDPGFVQRSGLWRIPTWLAMVEVDGPQHLEQLQAALCPYL
jgi:protein-ribulosamine 3-kinase